MGDGLREALEQEVREWEQEVMVLRARARELLVKADQLEECRIKLSVKLEQNRPPRSPKQSSRDPG